MVLREYTGASDGVTHLEVHAQLEYALQPQVLCSTLAELFILLWMSIQTNNESNPLLAELTDITRAPLTCCLVYYRDSAYTPCQPQPRALPGSALMGRTESNKTRFKSLNIIDCCSRRVNNGLDKVYLNLLTWRLNAPIDQHVCIARGVHKLTHEQKRLSISTLSKNCKADDSLTASLLCMPATALSCSWDLTYCT